MFILEFGVRKSFVYRTRVFIKYFESDRHFEYMSIITIKKTLSLIEFFVGVIIFNQVNQARCDKRLRNKNTNSIFPILINRSINFITEIINI
jgi:hypothetical protein